MVTASTKDAVLELFQQHEAELRAFGVRRLGLFGSFVRDQATPKSDVDLLVEFAPGQKRFDTYMQLVFFLEELLGRSVELVTPEALSPHLGRHILHETEYVAFDA